MYDINTTLRIALDEEKELVRIGYDLEYTDLSDNSLESIIFSYFTDKNTDYKVFRNPDNQLEILKKMVKAGLDFNHRPAKSQSFTYGHHVIRHSYASTIQFVLDNGFDFNSYTKSERSDGPAWHSLELIHFNYFASKNDNSEILQIIKNQLNSGIDLSKSEPTDLFTKLNRNANKDGWTELLELYNSDKYMHKYFVDNIDVIIENDLTALFPQEARDIFIF